MCLSHQNNQSSNCRQRSQALKVKKELLNWNQTNWKKAHVQVAAPCRRRELSRTNFPSELTARDDDKNNNSNNNSNNNNTSCWMLLSGGSHCATSVVCHSFFGWWQKDSEYALDVLLQCEPLISNSKSAMEMLLQLYMIILMTPLCLPLSSSPLHSLRRYPFISHFLVFMSLPRPSHRSHSFCLPHLTGASITICVCGPHTKARFP